MIELMKFTAYTLLAVPAAIIFLVLLYVPMHGLAKAMGFRR